MSAWRTTLPFIGCLMLALSAGYLAGRLTSLGALDASAGFRMQPDVRPREATVRLERIEAGALVGSVEGAVRLVLDGNAVAVSSGAFRVPAGPLLTEVIPVVVPPGMRFVASKKGTRYYPVDSASGQGIVPENRVYFRTASDAVAAGYR